MTKQGTDEQGTPQRTILLARQSIYNQLGVDEQLGELREYCDEFGWGIGPDDTHIIAENATSGYGEKKVEINGRPALRTNRPEFQRAMEMLREKPDGSREADALLVITLDRGFRNSRDFEDLREVSDLSIPNRDKWAPPAVTVMSIDGSLDFRTPEDVQRSRKNLQAAIDYSARVATSVALSHKRRAKKGIYRGGGHRPYGYAWCDRTKLNEESGKMETCPDCNGGKLKVVEHEATEIRKAAQAMLDGKSMGSVYRDLKARKIATPDGARSWNMRSVLLSRSIASISVYRKNPIGDGLWKPILDRETWDQVGEILRDPSRLKNHGDTKVRYLGTGIFKCSLPDCDGVMCSRGGYYACGTCMRQSREMSLVDGIVVEALKKRLAKPDAENMLHHRKPEIGPEIAALKVRIRELDEEANDAREMYSTLKNKERFRKWISGIDKELITKQARLAQLLSENEEDDKDPEGIFGDPNAASIWDGITDIKRKREILRKAAVVWLGPATRYGRTPKGAGPDDGNITVNFPLDGDTGKPDIEHVGPSRGDKVRKVMEEMYAKRDSYTVEEVRARVLETDPSLSGRVVQNVRREMGLVVQQTGRSEWSWVKETESRNPGDAAHCAACGKKFTPYNSIQQYCSDDCKIEARQGRRTATRKAETAWRKLRQCEWCGEEFMPRVEKQTTCGGRDSQGRSCYHAAYRAARKTESKRAAFEREVSEKKARGETCAMPNSGTRRGAAQHKSRGEEPCDICRQGSNAEQRAYRTQR